MGNVTDQILLQISDMITKLKSLEITDLSLVTDVGIDKLSKLTTLRKLVLKDDYFTGKDE